MIFDYLLLSMITNHLFVNPFHQTSIVKSNGETPSPKRVRDDISGIAELSSTSKKLCTKVINLEDVESNEKEDDTGGRT